MRSEGCRVLYCVSCDRRSSRLPTCEVLIRSTRAPPCLNNCFQNFPGPRKIFNDAAPEEVICYSLKHDKIRSNGWQSDTCLPQSQPAIETDLSPSWKLPENICGFWGESAAQELSFKTVFCDFDPQVAKTEFVFQGPLIWACCKEISCIPLPVDAYKYLGSFEASTQSQVKHSWWAADQNVEWCFSCWHEDPFCHPKYQSLCCEFGWAVSVRRRSLLASLWVFFAVFWNQQKIAFIWCWLFFLLLFHMEFPTILSSSLGLQPVHLPLQI